MIGSSVPADPSTGSVAGMSGSPPLHAVPAPDSFPLSPTHCPITFSPQHDRLVVRAGRPIDARPPPYELLDDLNVPHEQRGAEAMVEKDVLVCASRPSGCSPAAPRHCKAPVLDRVRAYLPMVITLLVGVTLGAGTVGFAPRR